MGTKTATIHKCIGLITLLFLTTACGDKGFDWVKDAEVDTYTQRGDAYAEVTTYLDTHSMRLPNLKIPVVDPDHPGVQLGRINIRTDLSGSSRTALGLAVNLNETTKLPSGGGKAELPNGTRIPVSGVDKNNLLVLDVGGSDSRVYLDIDAQSDAAMIGVAVPVEEFGDIGKYLPGVGIFPRFELDNGIRGTFGIFTGSAPEENGFALFMDASQMLQSQSVQTTLAQGSQNKKTTLSTSSVASKARFQSRQHSKSNESRSFRFHDARGSNYERYIIGTELQELSNEKAKLSVE